MLPAARDVAQHSWADGDKVFTPLCAHSCVCVCVITELLASFRYATVFNERESVGGGRKISSNVIIVGAIAQPVCIVRSFVCVWAKGREIREKGRFTCSRLCEAGDTVVVRPLLLLRPLALFTSHYKQTEWVLERTLYPGGTCGRIVN